MDIFIFKFLNYILVKPDYFLSKIFQKNCGKLDIEKNFDINSLKNYYFISSKSKASVLVLQRAIDLNFNLIQLTILFEKKLKEDYSNCFVSRVEFANDSDIIQLEAIAYESFVFDRFHRDINIPNKIASEIKKQWIGNFFKEKRGDKCFVSRDLNGKVNGFLLTKKQEKEIVIDLISVSKNHRGKGVAKTLINTMFSYYRKEIDTFSVSTQLENVNSISLYKSTGFKIKNYFFNWHYINNKYES